MCWRALRPALLAVLVVAVACADAAAAISGRVAKPGYTLIVLGTNAKGASTVKQRFRAKAPTRTVTLHLRARDGGYAGPVVVGRPSGRSLRKRRVLMGVKDGAKLGTVIVRNGYATLARRLPARYRDERSLAKARDGVPIGVRNLGRVRSRMLGVPRSSVNGGADPDRDGIPNAFDADNDGDLVLDNSDKPLATGRRHAAAAQEQPACQTPPRPQNPPECATQVGVWTFSQLVLSVPRTINANAGLTRPQIDDTMSGKGSGTGPDYAPGTALIMQVAPGDTAELDCGGLTYCRAGGTGEVEVFEGPQRGPRRFPDEFDGDGDGFGDMISAGRDGPSGREFTLLPHATSLQIGPGDTFIERTSAGGAETQVPGSLAYVFSTVPAIVAYTDGRNSGTIAYPAAGDPPGTERNPIEVAPNAQGHIVWTMTLWRPQRAAFPNEPGEFIDLGHLAYPISSPSLPSTSVPAGGPGQRGIGSCNVETYSTTDPNLRLPADDPLGGPIDQSGDAPPNPGRTLTFSIDLTECLDGHNEEGVRDTWEPGEVFDLTLQAKTPVGDNGGQRVFLRRK